MQISLIMNTSTVLLLFWSDTESKSLIILDLIQIHYA